MNCTPEVRQKNSNFWGAVYNMFFSNNVLTSSKILQHYQKRSSAFIVKGYLLYLQLFSSITSIIKNESILNNIKTLLTIRDKCLNGS